MTKHFNYWLTGTGWAEVFVTSDNEDVRFEFSYLSDPLAELFEGLYRINSNQSDNEQIIFLDEPGAHLLVITKLNKETLKVQIFRSDEWGVVSNGSLAGLNKQLVYSDIDTFRNLSLVICAGIDNLLERHSLPDYREKWALYDFPMDKYIKLVELLK